jgi:multiple sugar transport system ATP-binding protein
LQIGTPQEIYEKPTDIFTAGFIGSPPMNFIRGERLPFIGKKVEDTELSRSEVIVGIRPEDISVSLEKKEKSIEGKSSVTETLGSDNYLYVDISDLLVCVRLKPDQRIPEDQDIWLVPNLKEIHIFGKSTGKRT